MVSQQEVLLARKNVPAGPRDVPAIEPHRDLVPNLTANALKVLRLVSAGDPFRDKGRGAYGRAARVKQLEWLRDLGLVRATGEGFWRATSAGKAFLLINPVKRGPRHGRNHSPA